MKLLAKILLICGIAILLGTSGASDCDIYTISQVFKAICISAIFFIASYISHFIGIAME